MTVRRAIAWGLGASILAATALPATAQREGDATRGQLLYALHCTGCHTSQAHVRANRKARTPADLRAWVRRWESVQELSWSEDDVRDVATWLYLRFYDPERPVRSRGATDTGSRLPPG